MASCPPAQIQDLFKRIQSLSTQSLAQQPYYVDPRAFNSGTPPSMLRLATSRNAEMQESYHSVQEAFFDFAGRCMYCDNPEKHVHSVQAGPVLEVEGFPGLYVYPKLLGNPLVHKGLIDMLLHHELADPRTRTNLHEKYHITYPEPLSPSGEANASFFDPVASQLKMQPRLEGSDNWTTSPITAREFVEKLRWFIIGDTSADGSRASMPPRIKALVENVVPIKTQTATAYLSSSQDSLELRQGQGEDGKFLDISLGCDGIFVLGLEGSGDEERETTSSVGQSDDDDSWRNLVVSPDSEDDGKAPAHQHAGEAGSNDKTVSSTRNAPRLAAIHLRSSDALLFTGPSKRAWYGVARILTGSSPTWEQQWPCWPGTIDSRRMEDWKGCMKGRRIDLVVR